MKGRKMGLKKIFTMASLAVGVAVAPVSKAQAQPRPHKNAPRVENCVSARDMKKQQKKRRKKSFCGWFDWGIFIGIDGPTTSGPSSPTTSTASTNCRGEKNRHRKNSCSSHSAPSFSVALGPVISPFNGLFDIFLFFKYNKKVR